MSEKLAKKANLLNKFNIAKGKKKSKLSNTMAALMVKNNCSTPEEYRAIRRQNKSLHS